MPFSVTKQCTSPQSINDSRSPYFSEEEFLSLLSPHVPRLLGPDKGQNPLVPGIHPLIKINPSPRGEDLVKHPCGYRFLPSFTNVIYALLYRVCAEPAIPVPKTWPSFFDWFLPSEPIQYHPILSKLEYIQNLKPHQKRRILKAFDDLELCIDFSSTTPTLAKSDELLFKTKPRIIWAVPPGFQARLGPIVRTMTHYLKHIADGKTILTTNFTTDIRYTVCFACGMTAEGLSEWFNYSLNLLVSNKIDWAGIFMGDDTFILERSSTGKITCRESDFSAFDTCQRSAAQKRLRSIYRSWGVDEDMLFEFKRVAQPVLAVVYGPERQYKFKIKMKEPQTATGKPDTCLGNTLLTMDTTIHYMNSPLVYADFGFVAKTLIHPNLHGTFLKGHWSVSLDGLYHWNPLPSAILKLVKSFAPYKDIEKCLQGNLSSIGPVATPLIRVLNARFSPEFKKLDTVFKTFTPVLHPVSESNLEEFISYRYGHSVYGYILAMERELTILPLGAELYHPLWKILADVDHGDGREYG